MVFFLYFARPFCVSALLLAYFPEWHHSATIDGSRIIFKRSKERNIFYRKNVHNSTAIEHKPVQFVLSQDPKLVPLLPPASPIKPIAPTGPYCGTSIFAQNHVVESTFTAYSYLKCCVASNCRRKNKRYSREGDLNVLCVQLSPQLRLRPELHSVCQNPS